MAETYKRLGTSAVATVANTVDNGGTGSVYTVISSIVICNTTSSTATYTISTSSATIAAHGAYIAYTANIAAYDTVVLVAGICLDTTVRYLVTSASVAGVHITAYGVQGP